MNRIRATRQRKKVLKIFSKSILKNGISKFLEMKIYLITKIFFLRTLLSRISAENYEICLQKPGNKLLFNFYS